MKRTGLERGAAVVVCAAGILFMIWLIFKYAFDILTPFIVAWLIGFFVSGPADALARRTGISRRVCGVVLMIILLTIGIALLTCAVDRALAELCRLAAGLGENGDGSRAISRIIDYTSNMTSRIPVLRELRRGAGNELFWDELDAAIKQGLGSIVKGAGNSLTAFAGKLVTTLPSALVFAAAALIASFYFCSGVELSGLTALLPPAAQAHIKAAGGSLRAALSGWLRAYLLIFVMTFIELFIGLSLLGVNYSFLFALVIAALDILPVFGAGAVLAPWGIIALVNGSRFLGFGLLILWAVLSIVRQVAEPKIVGKSLGLHPLIALFSMYAGLKLLGFAGIILAPAVAMLIRYLVSPGRRAEL